MVKLRCPVCRSRQWRKEPSSGMLVCSEGHILQGYRNETIEQTDIPQFITGRRVTKVQKKTRDIAIKNSNHFYGHEAKILYFQSQQLLLRHQIKALRHVWSLPVEFERICKDVWTLHLMALPNPTVHPHSTRTEGATTSGSTLAENPDSPLDEENNTSDDENMGVEVEVRQQDDLARLLEDISNASSESDEEGNVEDMRTDDEESHKRHGSKPTYWIYSRASANVAILVVACWVMRLPALYADFTRLIDDYVLPYLDPIERGLLPESMVKHMNRSVKLEVSPLHSPRPLHLHHLSSRLASKFSAMYRVMVPEANVPTILSRCLRDLHLPVIFYRIIIELADILELSFSLHPSLAQIHPTGRTKQTADNIPVEMALACVAILSLKLVYGLDGLPLPASFELDAMKLPAKEQILNKLSRDDYSYTQRKDRTASDLSQTEVDEYLDFCSRALLSNAQKEDEGILERIFRVRPNRVDSEYPSSWPWTTKVASFETENAAQDGMDEVTEHLNMKPHYKVYRSSDALGLLPEEYGLVATAAARWCGVTVDDISIVLERYERRILRGTVYGPRKSGQQS